MTDFGAQPRTARQTSENLENSSITQTTKTDFGVQAESARLISWNMYRDWTLDVCVIRNL